MNKAYQRINWQNKPATATPTGATNFNKMDKAIDDIDNRVVEINGSIESMQVAINGKASATALSDEVTARQNADASLMTTLNNHQTEIDNKYDKVYSDGTDGTLTDSDDGLLKNLVIKGKCEQGENPSPSYPQPIRKVVNPTINIGKGYATSRRVCIFSNGLEIATPNATSANENSALSYVIPCQKGEKYKIVVDGNAKINGVEDSTINRFRVALTNENPITSSTAKINVGELVVNDTSVMSWDVTVNNDYKYIVVTVAYADTYNKIDGTVRQIRVIQQKVQIQGTFYGIGSTCDYIDVEKGKVVRRIASSKTLDYGSNLGNYVRCFASITDCYSPTIYEKENAKVYLSVMDKSKNKNGFSLDEEHWYKYDKYLFVFLPYSLVGDNQSSLNEYLNRAGYEFIYAKEEPIEEDLDATVLAQLRALTSYYPSTNLVITSDEINGNASYEYLLNLESFIHNVHNGLQTLSDALEG